MAEGFKWLPLLLHLHILTFGPFEGLTEENNILVCRLIINENASPALSNPAVREDSPRSPIKQLAS